MVSERIKLVRKNNKLSQEAFGEKIGVTRNYIKNIDEKKTEPKPVFIKALVAEFNVNERWLKYGEGEMYHDPEKNEENKLFRALMNSEDPFLKKTAFNLPLLSSKDLKSIHDIIESLVQAEQKGKK